MRIYFFGNPHSTPQLMKRFDAIMGILEKMGALVLSNLKKRELFTQEVQKMLNSDDSMAEKIDALVIEGSNQSFESAHLIALALAHKKKVLYLVEKNKYIDKNLLKLENDKKTKIFFKIALYQDYDLGKILQDFIRRVEHGSDEIKIKPTIKFTLRVTPKMERYLQWKTHNTKSSKADFLREAIEDMIKNEEEYKKFLDQD